MGFGSDRMSDERFELLDETIFDNQKQAEDGGRVTYWVVEYQQRQELVDLLNELNDENKKLRHEKKRWIEKTDKLEQYIDSLFFGNTHICKHLDVEMAKFWCDKEQKYHLPQCKYKDCFKKENLVKTADEVLRSVE